jgi:hypothetical protein
MYKISSIRRLTVWFAWKLNLACERYFGVFVIKPEVFLFSTTFARPEPLDPSIREGGRLVLVKNLFGVLCDLLKPKLRAYREIAGSRPTVAILGGFLPLLDETRFIGESIYTITRQSRKRVVHIHAKGAY